MFVIKIEEAGAREKITEILSLGGTAVIPTDTVYGLACDAANDGAVEKLFLQKRRPGGKAIPALVSGIDMAKQIVRIDARVAQILERLWPGPFTAVFFSKHNLSEKLNHGSASLAVRVPRNDFAVGIIESLGRPIAVTSANVSGGEPHNDIERVLADFHEEPAPDAAIDAGVLSGNIASTVVDFTKSTPQVLREGPVSREQLRELFNLYLS